MATPDVVCALCDIVMNIINRRNVTASPSGNVTAREEFFQLVTEAHILTGALTLFKMKSLDDLPHTSEFPLGCEKQGSSEARTTLLGGIEKLLSQFVDLQFCQETSPPEDRVCMLTPVRFCH